MTIASVVFAGMIGTSEWVVILVAILILFGGKKIPELMSGIGKGIREFNNAKDGIRTEIERNIKEEPHKELPKQD